MITTRRGLLGMFAAGAAAAIVRTPGLLMPIKARGLLTLADWAKLQDRTAIPQIAQMLEALPWQTDIPFRVNPEPGDTLELNGKTWRLS